MISKTILAGIPALLAAMTAAPASAATDISPADYARSFSARTIPAAKAASVAGKTARPSRIAAFAGDGCAEVDRYGRMETVAEEDFSLLTTGSEEQPDLSESLEINPYLLDDEGFIILDEYGNPTPNPEFEYPWNNMKNEYTHTPGWGVGNAYPAGGALYFPFSRENPQGKFNSHWIDLSAYDGTFVVEFRVRLTQPQSQEMPSAIIVQVAETNNMAPMWDMFEDDFVNYENISEEWTTFRLIFQGGGPSTIVNIVGQGIEGGMLLDDVRICSLDTFVKAPALTGHSDFADESFTLNWEKVEGADGYLVNCWHDDVFVERVYSVENGYTDATSMRIGDTDPLDVYYYDVRAVKGDLQSLAKRPREVFDITAPVMRGAVQTDELGRSFSGGVESVEAAYGYNYFAEAVHTAEADGPFTLTSEHFTGWRHPLYEDGEEYTKENPADAKIASLYYPTDIRQQGWYGKNFQIYKDYICLVPFFYTSTGGLEQTAWISPEFDLSKDGGKISVDLRLAADYDIDFNDYSQCAVGLFNWNDQKGDYDQAEVVYCKDLTFDWQDRHVELNGGTERSVIAFFGLGTYGDLYIDDIVIRQNYKKGEVFHDPFFFRTWQLAESDYSEDPTTFNFTVTDYASGNEITQKAQAVRIHLNAQGQYDGEKASAFSGYDRVAFVEKYESGVSLVENDIEGNVKVRNGRIFIYNPERLTLTVTAADGSSASLGNASETSYAPASRGVYIVSIGNRSVKIAL